MGVGNKNLAKTYLNINTAAHALTTAGIGFLFAQAAVFVLGSAALPLVIAGVSVAVTAGIVYHRVSHTRKMNLQGISGMSTPTANRYNRIVNGDYSAPAAMALGIWDGIFRTHLPLKSGATAVVLAPVVL